MEKELLRQSLRSQLHQKRIGRSSEHAQAVRQQHIEEKQQKELELKRKSNSKKNKERKKKRAKKAKERQKGKRNFHKVMMNKKNVKQYIIIMAEKLFNTVINQRIFVSTMTSEKVDKWVCYLLFFFSWSFSSTTG